jgi:hypothetical protein
MVGDEATSECSIPSTTYCFQIASKADFKTCSVHVYSVAPSKLKVGFKDAF